MAPKRVWPSIKVFCVVNLNLRELSLQTYSSGLRYKQRYTSSSLSIMTSYPSNANNSSTTTVSSTQTLVPAKDYASAFADLQSKYGFGGNAPSPNPEPDTQDAAKKAALKEEDKALTDEAGKYGLGGSQSQQK
ncbi:hypothetical protein EV421DRAFT_1905571 [Armillaria borealis]|uniref:Uncharacterized protein n=1 Tax=Armillaria borealis TaxID=47425 RepID=A0AA39MN74_9AGAR|nr:hypothetical protein EV421DRAFT_1905571 [Armillaria borealis]